MARNTSHDQNFKNLIVDYPRQALALFAADEAAALDDTVRITPIRQEQLKNRLGDRFHELDVPLLVEWPDGRREALLFVLEEQSDPTRFSIHRLGHYSLDLSELFGTSRVVPVVVFLRAAKHIPSALVLGSERHTYLTFTYLKCELAATPWYEHRDSDNLVARLNLPNMLWPAEQKVEVYASAIRGLLDLEPDPERRLKYIDFVDIYTALDDNEMRTYQERYPQENRTMATLSERLLGEGRQQGMQEGMQKGMQKGELALLARQLNRRFGPLDASVEQRLQQASTEELERWADNILDAQTLEEVFTLH